MGDGVHDQAAGDEDQPGKRALPDPEALLDRVTDRESFFAFLQALILDREDEVAKEKVQPSSSYGPGANGWENGTIESYLDSALRWAVDNAALGRLSESASWRVFADILYGGKIYE
jgi:hypothetical protein